MYHFSSNIKKFILFLLCSFSICFCFPQTVFATETTNEDELTGDINEFSIEITENGVRYGGDLSSSRTDDMDQSWSTVMERYKGVVIGVAGVAALTFILIFIWQFTKFGTISGNPQARSQAMIALVLTGIGAAGCGSVTIFFWIFYYMFR